jgi:ribosomal protein S18 acetylase RimI-like enzyme
MEAGMALGAAPGADADALERSHHEAVADAGRIVIVAEVGGDVVAMAQIVRSGAANAPHRAEVQRVAVAESARGSGIGRRLLEMVEQVGLEHGLTLLWLTTHADSDACAFYEGVGYTKLGVLEGYSLRPDGTLSPAAFYFKELRRSR